LKEKPIFITLFLAVLLAMASWGLEPETFPLAREVNTLKKKVFTVV
tara:strand:- start:514 stop:651 length:138 start_codon:yes stop_codon:yes gene_type:complete